MPRPYVAAESVCVVAEAESATTGAGGSPVPNRDQQSEETAGQVDTCVVRKTPTSVAT